MALLCLNIPRIEINHQFLTDVKYIFMHVKDQFVSANFDSIYQERLCSQWGLFESCVCWPYRVVYTHLQKDKSCATI